MKFELNDKVKIISTGKVGIIKAYKYERSFNYGKLHETYRYYINAGGGYFNWYDEKDLRMDGEYEFKLKFEINFLNLLIDINLSNGNYEMVKQLNDEKVKLERGGKQWI